MHHKDTAETSVQTLQAQNMATIRRIMRPLISRAQSVPDALLGKSPYFILAVVCAAMFLDLANLSAVTIALPSIQKDLGVKVAELQWVISAYALTVGLYPNSPLQAPR